MQVITAFVRLKFRHKKTAWQGGFLENNVRDES